MADKPSARIYALLLCHIMTRIKAELTPKLITCNLTALQITKETHLFIWVKDVTWFRYANLLKTAYRAFKIQRNNHTSQIKNYCFNHYCRNMFITHDASAKIDYFYYFCKNI